MVQVNTYLVPLLTLVILYRSCLEGNVSSYAAQLSTRLDRFSDRF